MQDELRKLAAMLRKIGQSQETNKMVKCAQAAQTLIAFSTLRRKIGVTQ